MAKKLTRALGLLACLSLLYSLSASAGTIRHPHDLHPTGKGWGEHRTIHKSTTVPGYGINYHGGQLMLGTPNVYFIWYGNWSGSGTSNPLSDSPNTVSLLDTLFSNSGLNGSPYENIDTTYYQLSGTTQTNVSGDLALLKSTTNNYSYGKRISDSNVQSIVASAIRSGALGNPDTNGIYFVLTSSDVAERSGFCSQYCGWHTHANISVGGKYYDIKYAFVGNPDRCPSACEWQSTSPNSDSGADGMANIMAHESEETISDPDLNAWYDNSGEENADKCAWQFGTVSTLADGAQYNQTIAGLQWLIQMNWANVSPSGQCQQTN